MSVARHHAEWLSLIEVSGPFLSMPVLLQAFPDGLDKREDESGIRSQLHAAYEEWLDNQLGLESDPAIHRAWIRFVLRQVLDIDDDVLAEGQSLPAELSVAIPEHGERLRPTWAVVTPEGRSDAGRACLLVDVLLHGQSLDGPMRGSRWKASAATRMMTLLHGAGPKLGLITNGEHWMLVHAVPGETTTFASFYANLFFEEPLTLRAFHTLLSAHRFFSVPDDATLESLLAKSSEDQHEVTDQLGYQVRRAVEVLVQNIDRIDRDRGRALLRGFDEQRLYEATVTVMMRLVFLLAAEERGLLPLGEPLYDSVLRGFHATRSIAGDRGPARARGAAATLRRLEQSSRDVPGRPRRRAPRESQAPCLRWLSL